MSKQKKSNILVIMSDQHSFWASGAYGHPFIRTPNLDRLAQSGIVFDGAYANSPICGPSRSSFLAGKLPSSIEAWDNEKPLPSDIPTWAHYLTIAGYQTVLAGKQHFKGPDQSHGFELRLGGEVHSTRMTKYGVDFRPPSSILANLAKWYKPDVGRTTYLDYDDDITEKAVSFLEGNERDNARPFALCVSLISPHPPLTVEDEYFDLYWPEHADLPVIPEGYHLHPAWQSLRDTNIRLGFDCNEEESIRRARAAYYGLVTFTDRKVGQVLEALERSGLDEDTIIVYTSDHGEFLGSRGLWGKSSFFEESVRVPLIVSWPGHLPKHQRRSEVVSLVDLAATILDWSGVTDQGNFEGRSFGSLLDGNEQDWQNVAISEYVSGSSPWRMIRQGKYKLNYFPGELPELYDLEADPGEWNDLAADPSYAGVVAELTARVMENWNVKNVVQRVEESIKHRILIGRAELVYRGEIQGP